MAKRGELTKIEQEFADFVDTHDTVEMIEKGELFEVSDVKITIPSVRCVTRRLPPRKTAITMKIYPALLNRIKKVAEAENMPYQSLINQWLAERTYFEEHKEELATGS